MIELRGKHGLLVHLDERAPDKSVASIVGDLAILESQDLESLLTRLAARSGLIVVDLSKVGMASSLAMGVFVALQRAVRNRGGKIRIAAASPLVFDSFKRVRLDQVFEFKATVDEALAD